MKKSLFLAALFIAFATINSVAQAYEPFEIGIYTKIKSPGNEVAAQKLGTRVGEATAHTVLGIVNWGDCSLETAMRNGRITKVYGSDWEKSGILFYGKKTFKVYGE